MYSEIFLNQSMSRLIPSPDFHISNSLNQSTVAENYKPLYTIFQDRNYPFNAHSRSQVVYYNFVKFQYQSSVHPFRSSWTDKKYGQKDGKCYLYLPLESFCLRRYNSNFTPSHPFRRSWTDKKYGQTDGKCYLYSPL